jgi:hypothetical protein
MFVVSSYLDDAAAFAALCKRKELVWQSDGFPCYMIEEILA